MLFTPFVWISNPPDCCYIAPSVPNIVKFWRNNKRAITTVAAAWALLFLFMGFATAMTKLD